MRPAFRTMKSPNHRPQEPAFGWADSASITTAQAPDTMAQARRE